MIFTDCPYCDELQIICWECGDPNGYFPSKCPKCGKVMWVEATSFGGTCRTHEDFKKEIMKPGDEQEIEAAAARAKVCSTVIYQEGCNDELSHGSAEKKL